MTDTENQSTDVEISVPQDILEYETDYEIGQDNVEMFGLDMHNPVFILSAGIVLLFSVLTLIFPVASGQVLQDAKSSTLFTFDWLFALTPSVILVFCLGLCLTPLGKIRLGGQDAVPEFKIHSWVAMLFAAGVGVGFMFWGAAEPLAYYTGWSGTPLAVELTEAERAIAEEVGAWCREQGFMLAGLDLIGEHLIEVNVTSPTGLRTVQTLYGTNPAERFWQAVEARRTA